MSDRTLKVAVIGAGLLGIDLVDRLVQSSTLSCALVVGRHSTAGIRLAARMGCPTSTDGIGAVTDAGIDLVFDTSTAEAHAAHGAELTAAGVVVVNLTPGGGGTVIAPTINGEVAVSASHLSLVSCGGQAVLPVLDGVRRHCAPRYVEVVTTVAAASVGRATRLNLDEYLHTTGYAVGEITGVPRVKVLTTISPALPAPPFRARISVLADDIAAASLCEAVAAAATSVRAFAPGYEVTSCSVHDDLVTVTVTVTAHSDRLPAYAGNVEIINAAALVVADAHAAARHERGSL
jgi:acetaldehyde dehydrogenase